MQTDHGKIIGFGKAEGYRAEPTHAEPRDAAGGRDKCSPLMFAGSLRVWACHWNISFSFVYTNIVKRFELLQRSHDTFTIYSSL